MIVKSTRGSEWRKWDLHIHTPASDGKGTPEEIVNEAITKGLSVIAITDHHTTDYIDKVKIAAQGTNLTVISGIEFRSEYGAKSVHFIAYFPDEYNGTKLTSQNLYDLILCKLNLSRPEIILEGRKKDSSFNDEKAFKEGIFLLQVDMKKACNLIHSYGGIISVHNGNKKNGLDAEVKHYGSSPKNARTLDECLGPLKDELMTDFIDICDLGLSCNDRERTFYLKEFNTPSILASDAHEFKEIGSAFTWIKADPSFDGLKQIIYEPESRVKFQADKPEQKNDYQIIDSITFDNEEMGKQEIKFNPNLNTVIGGRSSGKSILISCLACLNNCEKEPKEPANYYKDYNNHVHDLIKTAFVKWADGSQEPRKIIYYSQSEISEKVRPDEYGIPKINKLIESIVKKESEFSNQIQQYESFLITNRSYINSKINDFCELRRQKKEKIEKVAELGNKNGIIAEIEKINSEIETIKKSITNYLSDEDDAEFKKQKDNLSKLGNDYCNLESDENQIEIAKNIELFTSIDSTLSNFSALTHDKVEKFYNELKNNTKERWIKFIEEQKQEIKNSQQKTLDEIHKIRNSELYKKGLSFNKSNELLSIKEEALQHELEKKNNIEKKESELQNIQQTLNNYKENIWLKFEEYKEKAKELANHIVIEKDNVKISAHLNLIYKPFFERANNVLNRRSKDVQKYDNYEEKNLVEKEAYIKDIYEGIVEEKFTLKQDIQQALVDLFTNHYYKISYDVTYDGDSFKTMSEGKKAFIVLRLLLDFDDSKCPIIIDQPEDDLDNRAIYDKLVTYIRDQKTKRQIILATHNPNVVVGADAELVIVANQNGTDTPNQDEIKFEYYGNSIENSFKDETCSTILLRQGIREHICDILEGGNTAFQIRERKYGYKN